MTTLASLCLIAGRIALAFGSDHLALCLVGVCVSLDRLERS